MNEEQPPRKNLLGIGLALLLATASFFSGLQMGSADVEEPVTQEASLFSLFRSPEVETADEVNLEDFWRVWNLLEEKYVGNKDGSTLSSEKRIEGAIDGLVASYGDPYTVFMPPQESADFQEEISGNFSGVGMEVGMRDGLITVIAPLPGSPSEKAGVLTGDAIVRINGTSTERMNIDEAVDIIRGEQGTSVSLTVLRAGVNELVEFSIVRDIITIPTIVTKEQDDVFIITLYNFNALAESQMQQALRDFVTSGKKKMIIDVRGNPGGFLQSANAIASYFLPAGKVIVRENFGDGRDEVQYRSQGKTLGDFNPEEIVMLIDGGSASAAEILAGALQEHDVAVLIGETTFGKGSVQELIGLPDGSSLKVTIARWMTPEGKSISDGGLAPDIEIIRTPQDRLDNKDPQLEAALKWMKGERDFPTATSTPAVTE